jgi:prephenate dehydratase
MADSTPADSAAATSGAVKATYSYLGPTGTFTEAALAQVPEAAGQNWRSVNNVGEALDDVTSGRSIAAMIAIENSVEGGVSATQDALASIPGLRIVGEYLVRVQFALVARPGIELKDVHVVNAHPVAYAQCRGWLEANLPTHGHIPSTSNVASALSLFDSDLADAAIAPPRIVEHHELNTLATDIGDNHNAVTRFVLVSRAAALPQPTGAARTARAVLDAGGQPQPAAVPPDRRCPREVPIHHRRRRAHPRRACRGCDARRAPVQPARHLPGVVSAGGPGADRVRRPLR